MADIQTYLKAILSAMYGKDVRQSIHDAIRQCYMDGQMPTVDLFARERIDAANGRIDRVSVPPADATVGNAELVDIRLGADGTTYSSAGTAVRRQIEAINTIEVSAEAPIRPTAKLWIHPDTGIVHIRKDIDKWVLLPSVKGQSSYEIAVAAGYTGTETEWMNDLLGDGWIAECDALEARIHALENINNRLIISNTSIAASAFINNYTDGNQYDIYPYRAAVPLSGVQADMIPEIVFNMHDAASGTFAPLSETYNGGLYIYATERPNDTVIIPTIIVWR